MSKRSFPNQRAGHKALVEWLRVLCQAVHTWVRFDPAARATYERLLARNPRKRNKIALVAMMRRLAIRLWHLAKGEAPPEARTAETRSSAISREP